jgi:hypothetical protein
VVSDAHEGIKAAVSKVHPNSNFQQRYAAFTASFGEEGVDLWGRHQVRPSGKDAKA